MDIILEMFFENMTIGQVVAFHVDEGQMVAKGQDIVDIETEKSVFTITSPAEGYIRKIYPAIYDVVPVGYVLATCLATPNCQFNDASQKNEILVASSSQSVNDALETSENESLEPTKNSKKDNIRAVPAARKLATKLGINLSDVAAIVGDKIIKEEDVQKLSQLQS